MASAALDPTDEVPEQVRVRRAKLDRLREEGVDPYPPGFPRTATFAEIRAAHPGLAPDSRTGQRVGVVGRVVRNRIAGRLVFATLRDGTAELQVMLGLDRVGAEGLAGWKRDIDLGDHVGIEGEVISSRSGELSVLADRWQLTAKSLRPLPDKHHGLTDPETRVRQRYVDLVVNPQSRHLLELRGTVLRSVRGSLTDRGYLEVETPILQPVHGGASARPFVTRMNAFGVPLYLRIALELYLKRVVVGGVERVFEIGRNFRNEGVDTTHNPEFTMLEAYQAYGDYDTMAVLVRDVILEATRAAFGGTVVRHPDGSEHDLGVDWLTRTVHDAVSEALGTPVTPDTPPDALRRLADAAGIRTEPGWAAGDIVLELYEHLVEARTVTPTFYRDFPTEVSPLTRAHRRDPRLAERWDLVAFGMELGTAYTELVDPVEQRRRLTAQAERAAGGDPEAMRLDEDFLRALEYGMPPTGGLGLGIDRLLIALTGRSIREIVLFPLIRPE